MRLVLVSLDVEPGPGRLKFTIPFHCKLSGRERIPRRKEYDWTRVEHITRLKNEAVAEAIEQYPKLSHVVMVESYYLGQKKQIESLIWQYRYINDPDLILGAPVWCYTVQNYFRKCTFYDGWACQELAHLARVDAPRGIVQVDSVGSAIVFPVEVWKKHHFSNPGYPQKIYYNWLCEQSHLPVLVDMSINFQRCTINGLELQRFWYPYRLLTRGIFQLLSMYHRKNMTIPEICPIYDRNWRKCPVCKGFPSTRWSNT